MGARFDTVTFDFNHYYLGHILWHRIIKIRVRHKEFSIMKSLENGIHFGNIFLFLGGEYWNTTTKKKDYKSLRINHSDCRLKQKLQNQSNQRSRNSINRF